MPSADRGHVARIHVPLKQTLAELNLNRSIESQRAELRRFIDQGSQFPEDEINKENCRIDY